MSTKDYRGPLCILMLFVASTGLGQQVPSTGSGGAPVVVENSDSKSSLLIDEGSVAAEAETNETETAIQDATEALKLNPQNHELWIERGNLLSERGEFERAIADYSEAIRLNPKSASAFGRRGHAWRETGAYQKAIDDYSAALQIVPEYARGYGYRGHTWYLKGEYPKAIADFDEAIERDPDNVYSYVTRGQAWNQLGQFARALRDFDEAIRRDPKYARAYLQRGQLRYTQGEFSQAIDDLGTSIDLDSSNAQAYFVRGLAWLELDELTKAIDDYSDAIRVDPGDEYFYFNRGIAFANQGKYDEAIADYSEAIRLNPEFALPYLNRGTAWSEIGDHNNAIADFSEAIRLDPTDARSHYNRGLTWHFMHQPEKARADFDEAVRLDPNLAEHVKKWPVASGDQEKGFAEVSLDQALSVPVEALAQGYLAVKYTSELATYVPEDGWQLQTSLDGRPITLTKQNVGTYLPSLRRRLAVYAQAIQERGYLDLSGPYIARIRAACERLGIQSGPTLIEQTGFRLTLTQSGIVYRGIVVESSLVLEDPMNTEIALVGRATQDAITLDAQLTGLAGETESTDCQVVLRKSDRTDHRFSAVYVIRGLDALLNQEETGPALQYLSEAIRLDATFPVAYAVRSQILSSAPDATYRNGELALRDAKHACELTQWKQWPYLRTLASAHAGNGDYETAIRWIREAIRLAPPIYQEELGNARDVFKQRKPLRLESDSIDIFFPFFETSADTGLATLEEGTILHFDMNTGAPGAGVATVARLADGRFVQKFDDISGAIWSYQGDRFAYYSQSHSGDSESLQIRTRMGSRRQIFDAPPNQHLVWHPAWSRDGQRIAVILMREAENPTWEHQADFSLHVIDVATADVLNTIEIPNGVLELPMPTTPSNSFRWSPDGKHILLSWASTVAIDLNLESVVTITPGFSVADWISDDSVLYFDCQGDETEGLSVLKGLYRRSVHEESAQLIAAAEKLSEHGIVPHPGLYPVKMSVSPSGRKLAIVVGATLGQDIAGSLRIHAVDSGKLDWAHPEHESLSRPIGEDSRTILHLQWSPDETKIAAVVMHRWASLTVELFDIGTSRWQKLADIKMDLQSEGVAAIDFVSWHKALSWCD